MTPQTEKSPVSDLDANICEILGLAPISLEDLEASRLEMIRRLREEDGASLEDEDPDADKCDYNCPECDVPCTLED